MNAPLPAEDVAVPADKLSEFWRRVYPEGMTVQNVLDELHDLETVADNVPKVYDHVTGGRISKANTLANVVIAVHDDLVEEAVEDARQEAGAAT